MMSLRPPSLLAALLSSLLFGIVAWGKPVSYVEFAFEVPHKGGNAFERELFAELSVPGGRTIRIPAFVTDERGQWAVRVNGRLAGDYALNRILEQTPAGEITLHPTLSGVDKQHVDRPGDARGFIRIHPRNPLKFAFENGQTYFPLGMNCAWSWNGDYREIFPALSRHGLNWSRIWMAHWGLTNLEWLPGPEKRSPKPGVYDLAVAQRWDAIISEAERAGVYFQLVFQHHGQFSTEVNSNWADHPWNKANGGFLEKPGDFFRSEQARKLMRQKLRYAVARWSHSTSILAWELFNEVMFTDVVRIEKDAATIERWHKEMADYLRSIDPYRHLITTSTDEVDSSVYAHLDYIQPHRYSIDMISTVTGFDTEPLAGKPVFYGETGDDHFATRDKPAGYTLDPTTWASLCGGTLLPAQQWYHDRLIPTGRIASIGRAARFAREAGLDQREDLIPFQAEVRCESKQPYRLSAAFVWQKRRPTTVPITDGSAFHPSHADIPQFMVGTPHQVAEGYADRVSFAFSRSLASAVSIHIAGCGLKGAKARVLMDNEPVAEHSWTPANAEQRKAGVLPGTVLHVQVPSGKHLLTIINDGEDAIRFGHIELDRQMDRLACFGRKAGDLAVLFVWHRDAVFTEGGEPVKGCVTLPDLAPGRWQVRWWSPEKDDPCETSELTHKGGPLDLPTPGISRFAAAMLKKVP